MINHNRRADAALTRADVYMDLRIERVDKAVMRSPYHVWIEYICQTMAIGALHVVSRHPDQARLTAPGERRLPMN